MNAYEKRKSIKIENIITFLGIVVLCILVLLKFYTILVVNAPRELREATLAVFAQNIANGKNPYAISILESEIPPATSLYGFLVPLILAPFVKIFSFVGIGALQACQIVTLIVEIAGIYLGYKIIHLVTNNVLYSISLTIILYSCYWRYDACGGAFPDQWGVTLSIILAYLIYMDRKRKQYHPVVYAIIIVLLFYIKSYFVFVTFGLIVYLFINEWREALKLTIAGACIGGSSFLIVNMVFPLYFTEILPNGAGQTFNCGFGYSLKQIWESAIKFYFPISLIVIFYFVYVGSKIIRGIQNKESELWGKCKNEVFSFALCEIVCILPAVVIIGRNGGTYYTYYFQLWWIWVIFFSAEVVSFWARFIDSLNRKNKKMMKIVVIAMLITTIFTCKELLISTPLNKNECAEWEYVYSILDNYSQKGDVLIAAHLSSWAIDNDIETSEYGQQGFNNLTNLEFYNNNVLWKKIFPLADDIIIKNIKYNEDIRKNIKKQKYSCIALTDENDYGLEEEFLKQSGYYILDERNLLTGTWQWKTCIWICK